MPGAAEPLDTLGAATYVPAGNWHSRALSAKHLSPKVRIGL